MRKTALLVGVTGQDGSLLSQYLLTKNYKVIGTTSSNNLKNLIKLKIQKKISIIFRKKYEKNFFLRILKNYKIDYIFFLSGQSSVFKSENLKFETIESNTKPLIQVLECLRVNQSKIKLINFVSSEMFGSRKDKIDENSTINPQSFYGLAKSISYEIAKSYREQFKLNICNLILFNHESSLRPDNFILKKIIKESKNIKVKKNGINKIILGNLNVKRDWGWAPEYVELMLKIAESKYMEDFVIATGKTHKLSYLVKKILKKNKLSFKKNIKISKKLFRKNEIHENYSNISKIKKFFNWKPKYDINKIINELDK